MASLKTEDTYRYLSYERSKSLNIYVETFPRFWTGPATPVTDTKRLASLGPMLPDAYQQPPTDPSL